MSIIQHIRKLYIHDLITNSKFLSECTSCELTSIYIISQLKRLHIIHHVSKTLDECKIIDSFVIEVILYRRSHTFIIVKEKDKVYMISAYLNLYTSNIKNIDDFDTLINNLYKIEFEDDVELHNELFKTTIVPCLTLDKKYSKIKINIYYIL